MQKEVGNHAMQGGTLLSGNGLPDHISFPFRQGKMRESFRTSSGSPLFLVRAACDCEWDTFVFATVGVSCA